MNTNYEQDKRCKTCGETKPLESFSRHSTCKQGRAPVCKACRSVYDRSKKVERRPYERERSARKRRTTLRDRAQIFRARVEKIKADEGCSACKMQDPDCLEWHHVDGKAKRQTVSMLIGRQAGWARIEQELSLCIVLCANCHRKLHAVQKRGC